MRTTAEETQRNDENIIAAAIKVFSEKGYDSASMQDIADEAQISRGPLYYRYKTKKHIFLAALDVYTKHELDEQARILRQNKPANESLRDYFRYAIKYASNNSAGFPLDIFSSPDMQDVNARIREIYTRSAMITAKFVQSAIAEGTMKPETDVNGLVNLIFIIFDGLRYSHLKTGVIPTSEMVERTVEQICDLLITGYGIE